MQDQASKPSNSSVIKVIVFVIFAMTVVMTSLVMKARDKHKSGYYQMTAAEMVVVYYDTHKAFPKDWAALKPFYAQINHTGYVQSFDILANEVSIDFNRLAEYKTLETFDPAETESIITLIKDKEAHFVGGQADSMVVNYFTGKVEIDAYLKEDKKSKY